MLLSFDGDQVFDNVALSNHLTRAAFPELSTVTHQKIRLSWPAVIRYVKGMLCPGTAPKVSRECIQTAQTNVSNSHFARQKCTDIPLLAYTHGLMGSSLFRLMEEGEENRADS